MATEQEEQLGALKQHLLSQQKTAPKGLEKGKSQGGTPAAKPS